MIIFVSSVPADEGQRGQVGYSATKRAINGVVMPMARDLGKYGIRVAAIAPGVFETPIGAGTPEHIVKALQKMSPMGRFGKPDEFAHFVQTIIENSYINGVHLKLTGAQVIAHI